ncbi:MAG: thioesterase family protein [Desulfobacterales bacterium]
MLRHRIIYRVIYGDTDKMGVVYHANYLRWFEMGRTETFRHLGLAYKEIEKKGILLPVSEVWCKYLHPARYDDMLIIETGLDEGIKGGMKFDYTIFRQPEDGMTDEKPLVRGYTRHACITPEGRVVRPPRFLQQLIEAYAASHSNEKEAADQDN